MIYVAVLHFKRKELRKSEIIAWVSMWTAAVIIIIFPKLLRTFANTFLVTRVFDLMVICGFVLVISMVGSAYIRTKRIEKKLEDMIRKEAIKKAK